MSTAALPSLTPALPRELQVEVTGACNLACKMCLVRYRPKIGRSTGAMSFETFRRLVDALPDLDKVTLQGLGEPLLCPSLFDMVEYATARGIRVGFNSNATLLTRARAERVVAAGVHWLHVSVDGATHETYEGVRDGSDFARVTRNLAGLVEAKRRAGSATPRIQVVFVAMRRNVHELPDLVRLAAAWEVEGLWVQNLSHAFSDTDPFGSYAEIRDFAAEEALWGERIPAAREAFEEARSVAESLGVDLRLPRLEASAPAERRAPGQPGCGWPWDSAYVTHRGVVQPCCMVMGSDRVALGDASTEDFAEIWHSEPYQEFRAGLLDDGEPHEVCRGCSLYRGVF